MFKPSENNFVHFKKVLYYADINQDSTIFQFGVASGNTLKATLDVLRSEGRLPKKAFGFDSFMGLPPEETGVPTTAEWKEGAFNLVYELEENHHFQNMTLSKGLEVVKERFRPYNTQVELVDQWYSDLDSSDVEKYKIEPASFIDMDADLYISTIQAWKFIHDNGLIREGCLVRYDDWQTDENIGEGRAHNEIVEKYEWKFQEIFGCGKKVFKFIGEK